MCANKSLKIGMWVSHAVAIVSMRDGEIPPEVGLLLRPLSLLVRGVKAKGKWCLSRSSWHGKNSTHIFSGWWQWWVSIGLAIPVGHPQLLSSWFSPWACSRMEMRQIHREDLAPGVCSDISAAFPGRGGPCCPSSHVGRRQSRRLLPLPFPQQLQECFDVCSSSPEHPAPRLTTRQTPSLPPN